MKNETLTITESAVTVYADTPDDMPCPHFFETDNPVYGLECETDEVALCAETVFGIPALYPWQRLAIANILDAVRSVQANFETDGAKTMAAELERLERNEDGEKITDVYDEDGIMRGKQIILLPTGAGKSLCFQVPSLLMEGATVVIYPLLALMSDQFRRMKEGGLEPVIFKGGQTLEERQAQIARMEGSDGKPPAKLIIANPEVLSAGTLIDKIAACNIAHLAIDEAHCVSEWGDSFRPSYLNLTAIIKKLKPPAVSAFTATASPPVLKRIAEILFEGRAHLVQGESDRTNIIYFVRMCRIKGPALLDEVQKRKRPAVIFCASRNGTEQTAAFLRLNLKEENIRFYHAGLQREEKDEVEKWFHTHKSGILVTTCAWGMGVDKKDVKTVIHKDPPPTAEAYIQEAGRGGRDGSVAEAVLLWSPSDRERLLALPEKERKRATVIAEFAESGRCRREVLLEALGEQRAAAKTADDEVIACSGCDVCFKTAAFENEDERLILNFIRKNKRIYTREEAVSFLSERLKYWHAGDIKRILEEMVFCGLIKQHTGFLWKDKLEPA